MAVKKTDKNKIGAGKAGPGRPKGTPNRTTALIKDAIIQAATSAGNEYGNDGMVSYLQEQAHKNPGPFMGLLGKVLPTQLADADGDKLTIVVAPETKKL